MVDAMDDGDHDEHTVVGRLLFELASQSSATTLEFFTANGKGGAALLDRRLTKRRTCPFKII